MKVRLLPEAIGDLELGVDFYESQAPGLGAYFLDSLISDLDSLELFGGIHAMDRGIIGPPPNDFRSSSTMY